MPTTDIELKSPQCDLLTSAFRLEKRLEAENAALRPPAEVPTSDKAPNMLAAPSFPASSAQKRVPIDQTRNDIERTACECYPPLFHSRKFDRRNRASIPAVTKAARANCQAEILASSSVGSHSI